MFVIIRHFVRENPQNVNIGVFWNFLAEFSNQRVKTSEKADRDKRTLLFGSFWIIDLKNLFWKNKTKFDQMEADDDKSQEALEVNRGRMSITEEEEDDVTSEEDEDEDLSESGDDYDFYYGGDDDLDHSIQMGPGSQFNNNDDPEYFAYECLSVAQAKDILAETLASVCASIPVSSAEAKMALNEKKWKVDEAVQYIASKPPKPNTPPIALSGANTFVFCEVCAVSQAVSSFSYLSCRHHFCKGCWELHFECQILQGISTSTYLTRCQIRIFKKIVKTQRFCTILDNFDFTKKTAIFVTETFKCFVSKISLPN